MKTKIIILALLVTASSCTTPEAIKPGSKEKLAGSYVSSRIELFPGIAMMLNLQFDDSGKKGKFVARIENHSTGNNYAENVGGEFENSAEDPRASLVIEPFPVPSSTGMYVVEGFGYLKTEEGTLSTTLDITKRDELQRYLVDFVPSGL